uniref:Uncharacterized protein n=1 Tax=Brassica oleracea var. oleracea TaxID=109376 RepID=A0A0D2ZTB0_BRAOL
MRSNNHLKKKSLIKRGEPFQKIKRELRTGKVQVVHMQLFSYYVHTKITSERGIR